MYCDRCRTVFSASSCPICGNENGREPDARDVCFLAEKDHIWSGMLEDVLKQHHIPVMTQSNIGAGMALKTGPLFERIRFYVPFSCLQEATAIVNELFSADGKTEKFDL